MSDQKRQKMDASLTDSARTEKESRPPSFHNYPEHLAEKILGVNFKSLFNFQEQEPDQMVKMIEPPQKLLEKVFDDLIQLFNVLGFPVGPKKSEGTKSRFVGAILEAVVGYINRVVMKNNALELEFNRHFKELPESRVLPESIGRFDFVIDYQPTLSIKSSRLIVVEAKSGDIFEGVQQCMLYMLRLSEQNDDPENRMPIFGFCSNGVDWNFISYHLKQFKLMFKVVSMFPMMRKEVTPKEGQVLTKEEQFPYMRLWMERYSFIVNIIYSCLMSQISDHPNVLNAATPDEKTA